MSSERTREGVDAVPKSFKVTAIQCEWQRGILAEVGQRVIEITASHSASCRMTHTLVAASDINVSAHTDIFFASPLIADLPAAMSKMRPQVPEGCGVCRESRPI
jgi:hypothetical protein